MDDNLDLLTYQQKLNEFLTDSAENHHEVLKIRHIFKFIHKNFSKLNQTIQMADILKILHHSLRLEIQQGNTLHVGSFVLVLLNLYEQDDKALQNCLQILYQILCTMEDTQFLQIGSEVSFKLIEILLSHRSTPNNANIMACLQMYSKKFNGVEVITQLWTNFKDKLNWNQIIENPALLQILIYFFDDFSQHVEKFKECTEFTQLVKGLLNSQHHDNRKSAYYLLKKSHLFMEEQIISRLTEPHEQDIKRRNNFWSILISIFENLEENQSHLILPSLEQLKSLNISNLTEQFWLDILYLQILRHSNILVRRWILEHLLRNLTYFSMTNETQSQFMQALNDNSLYNVEGYMLPTDGIERFLNCDKLNFLFPFSRTDWRAVPLHYWLTNLVENWKIIDEIDVPHEVLFNLASKIRTMQNVALRQKNINLFKKLFYKTIEDMGLIKYVQLVEALYNISDQYEDIKVFFKKIENCKEYNLDGSSIFTLRFYNILTNAYSPDILDYCDLLSDIEEKINLRGWRPGFLRFLYRYKTDSDLFENKNKTLKQIYENYCNKLASTKEEENLIKRDVTDLFVQVRFSNYNDLASNECDVQELLNAGSFKTLTILSCLLTSYKPFVGRDVFRWFVESLRSHIKNDTICALVCKHLLEHCKLNLNNDELGNYGKMFLDLDLSNVTLFDSVTQNLKNAVFPIEFLTETALLAETKVGDSRIEEAYECKIFQRQAKLRLIRNSYARLLSSKANKDETKKILEVLYDKMQDINCKRPRYYTNSKEHRSMTHILSVVLVLLSKTNDDPESSSKLWKFLMEHNNQQNITILYQIAISKIIAWPELCTKAEEQLKASTCTPSQELSIIVILYRCYVLKCKFKYPPYFEQLINLLWPLTMGANFQTRLHAQLTISRLLDEYQKKNVTASNLLGLGKLNATIKKTLTNENIVKFNEDIRFMEVELEDAFGEVMDFTNAPYDEYNFIRYKRFQAKNLKSEHKSETPSRNVTSNCDVQRKLNPVSDFMPLSDLHPYLESEERQLYVVASLIEKIPNLGGIARTCEVLGFKNLVIGSKAYIAKPDFKSLSMTAEKYLNILEVKPCMLTDFILKKKTEGFRIIGAEQTANSCSFEKFEFPNRSLLLLGHEKEGIPPNLLGFLDYAVEIPQFGMIRSLNVHVTGALFMWEYFKQNIAKNN